MPKKDELELQPLVDEFPAERVAPLPNAARRAPFEVARPRIRRDADTEDLLNGMIAECHFAMREIAIPSACESTDGTKRRFFMSDLQGLAKAGAHVGQTIAMLRAADNPVVQGEVLAHVGRAIPATEKKT
jgi:hypothetical protein